MVIESTDELLIDLDDLGVARLTINRPERRNSLSWGVISSLRAAVASAKADSAVRVVVITGAGERAFCAGADLSGMRGDESYAEIHHGRGELARLFLDLDQLGKPTVARVRGYCLAGGFGLALACDLVIASDDSVFGTPEINVGLWPYMITVPLTRSMAPRKALELMMTGRRIDAAEADRLGFLTRVVPVGQLDAEIDSLAETLASKSAAVMRLGRDSFYSVLGRPSADALAQLHPLLSVNSSFEDATEGITAFIEKRPPRWHDR